MSEPNKCDAQIQRHRRNIKFYYFNFFACLVAMSVLGRMDDTALAAIGPVLWAANATLQLVLIDQQRENIARAERMRALDEKAKEQDAEIARLQELVR